VARAVHVPLTHAPSRAAVPRSRHNPQYNSDALAAALPVRGIRYDDSLHTRLGGLRKPNKDTAANAGWRNASFRGYADYMQTPQFDAALAELLAAAAAAPTAVMCAEALPWRCHRSLIADAAAARGAAVRDIMVAANGAVTQREHKSESRDRVWRHSRCRIHAALLLTFCRLVHSLAVTPFAVVSDDGRRVTYPAEAAAAAAAAAAASPRRRSATKATTTSRRRSRGGSEEDRTPSIERFFAPASPPGVVTRAAAKRARRGA
jgi:hypothetical protein